MLIYHLEQPIIGFADDIALVIEAKHIDEAELTAYQTVNAVQHWLESAGLKLAEHKTEAVLISSRKKTETASIVVGSHTIKTKEAIKYLGVMIDQRLNFKTHIAYACSKASKAYSALARMLPNIGGPKSSRRLLLSSVVKSITLYGSQIWQVALKLEDNKRRIDRVQRLNVLRVISAYRTTSGEAAMVVAGIMPYTLVAEEAMTIYAAKQAKTCTPQLIQELKAQSMHKWQQRWTTSDKGRWTYRLIPLIEPWINRQHGVISYDITQFLTGHGGYRSYLHRFGHDDSPYCKVCKNVVEDPEHAIFHCPRFNSERAEMQAKSGASLNPENIIEEMLRSTEVWDAVCEMVTYVQRALRRLEAERKRDISHQTIRN